jgi:hypothetical protein
MGMLFPRRITQGTSDTLLGSGGGLALKEHPDDHHGFYADISTGYQCWSRISPCLGDPLC